jgi:hypothetical protein
LLLQIIKPRFEELAELIVNKYKIKPNFIFLSNGRVVGSREQLYEYDQLIFQLSWKVNVKKVKKMLKINVENEFDY